MNRAVPPPPMPEGWVPPAALDIPEMPSTIACACGTMVAATASSEGQPGSVGYGGPQPLAWRADCNACLRRKRLRYLAWEVPALLFCVGMLLAAPLSIFVLRGKLTMIWSLAATVIILVSTMQAWKWTKRMHYEVAMTRWHMRPRKHPRTYVSLEDAVAQMNKHGS